MGRLTEALRRAANATDKDSREVHDIPATPVGAMNDATDDLFPIEFADSARRADALAGVVAEPAGGADRRRHRSWWPRRPSNRRPRRPSNRRPRLRRSPSQHPATDRAPGPPPVPRSRGPSGGRPSCSNAWMRRSPRKSWIRTSCRSRASIGVSRRRFTTPRRTRASKWCSPSAVVGEGKTLTASNLALTLSESYQRTVLLIDGDFRRPALHIVFNIDAPSGLSEGLMSVVEQKLPLHRVAAIDDSAGRQAQFDRWPA